MESIMALMDRIFPKQDLEGKKLHDVKHPIYGIIDTIFVSGEETQQELAAYEAAALARSCIPFLPT